MKETKLNEVLNYMKQYVENKYEHDSEPMLTYKDLQLVLEEIERLNNIIKEVREYITYWHYRNDFRINSFTTGVKEELLEILDKVGDDEE